MNAEELRQLDLAIARIEGVRDGLTYARELLTGGLADANVAAVFNAIAATPVEVVSPPVASEDRPKRKPSNRQKGDHTARLLAAAGRRLKIAQLIATDGPISMNEAANKLELKYHQVHGVVNRHPWFEIGDDRKLHLTPAGYTAVREANGTNNEDE